jgi:hypothetical protein
MMGGAAKAATSMRMLQTAMSAVAGSFIIRKGWNFMEDIVTSTEEGKKQWLASMAEMKAAWEEIKTSAMSGDSINTINDALRETVDILKENRDVIGGLIKDFAELTAMAAKATASAGSFIARQARDLSLQTQLAIANIRGLFTSDKNAWANNVTKANIIKQMYPEAESVKAGAMISKMPKYQMPVHTLSPVIVRDSQFGPFAGGYRGAKITESPLPNMPGGMQGPEMAQTFTTGWRVAMGQITEDFNQTFGSMVALGRESAKEIAMAMSDSFNDFFVDAIEGRIRQFKDYLLDFFKSIGRAIANMLSQYIAVQALGAIMPGVAPAAAAGGATAAGGANTAVAVGRGKATAVGATSPTIQIINNSGTPLTGTAAYSQTDMGETIMTIVLDAVGRNKGGSRDALRGMLA